MVQTESSLGFPGVADIDHWDDILEHLDKVQVSEKNIVGKKFDLSFDNI